MRAEFSKSVRRDAFARANGKCEKCGQKLFVGNVEYDHIVEAFMGGEATLENVRVLCRGCHKAKTLSRRPVIDKTRRQSDKNAGIRKRATIPGSKGTRWRRKMNGQVELRDSAERG